MQDDTEAREAIPAHKDRAAASVQAAKRPQHVCSRAQPRRQAFSHQGQQIQQEQRCAAFAYKDTTAAQAVISIQRPGSIAAAAGQAQQQPPTAAFLAQTQPAVLALEQHRCRDHAQPRPACTASTATPFCRLEAPTAAFC